LARRSRKKVGPFETFAHWDARWRKRKNAFWDRVFASRYGPLVEVAIAALFFALGLYLLFTTFQGLSTGILHGRGGSVRLSDAPGLFWMRFVWNLALAGLFVGGPLLGVWFRFGTARGKRTAAQRLRRAKKKSIDSE